MKTDEEIYKEWSGVEPVYNSCKSIHDSIEAIEFAKYYFNEMTKALSQDAVMLTFADLKDGILKHKAKSEYKQASIIIVRDVFKANAT